MTKFNANQISENNRLGLNESLHDMLALFLISCEKLIMQISSCCITFCGNVYSFTMLKPPGQLLTRE